MKPVRLKPNSPEFAEEMKKTAARNRHCDMPECRETGDYRAPKDRSLKDHYWFCRDHVSAYNAAWNYFSGMHPADIEHYVVESLYGHRPTRPFSDWSKTEEEIEAEIRKFRFGETAGGKAKRPSKDVSTPEREALRVLGLEETLDLNVIKARYKALAKQLHPDLNPGNVEAENKLKEVNMAYTILRVAFAKQAA